MICFIQSYIFFFILKVECLSDMRDNFCIKYSHFVSDNSQLLRQMHVATREAVLDSILCWKATFF